MPLKDLIRGQCDWADRTTRARAGHVLESIEANLFRPLHAATRAEFAAGSGDELGLSGRTAHLRSLRSSSALAANVFDPWRGLALDPIAAALAVDGKFTELHFEEPVVLRKYWIRA